MIPLTLWYLWSDAIFFYVYTSICNRAILPLTSDLWVDRSFYLHYWIHHHLGSQFLENLRETTNLMVWVYTSIATTFWLFLITIDRLMISFSTDKARCESLCVLPYLLVDIVSSFKTFHSWIVGMLDFVAGKPSLFEPLFTFQFKRFLQSENPTGFPLSSTDKTSTLILIMKRSATDPNCEWSLSVSNTIQSLESCAAIKKERLVMSLFVFRSVKAKKIEREKSETTRGGLFKLWSQWYWQSISFLGRYHAQWLISLHLDLTL